MLRLFKRPPIAVLTFTSAIALIWVVPHALRISSQYSAAQLALATGGHTVYDDGDSPDPKIKRWLRKTVGPFAVDSLIHINLRSPGAVIAPADIRALRRVTTLGSLSFSTTNLTPEHIDAIATLTQVRELYLDESTITDDDLAVIATFDHLELLSLCETPVTDRGLAHLTRATNLIALDLSDTDLSAAGLAHVAKLTQLEELYISRTPVGDDTLHLLRPLTNLHTLHLGEHVTDAGMPHVAALPALSNLSLENCPISNRGIALVMDSHPEFDYLHLFYTDVTADKMAEIEKSHPGILLQAAY